MTFVPDQIGTYLITVFYYRKDGRRKRGSFTAKVICQMKLLLFGHLDRGREGRRGLLKSFSVSCIRRPRSVTMNNDTFLHK